MIIYEKENKLNINFDNSTEAEPDVVISKEDGQVVIEAGGEPIGGGSEPLVVTFSGTSEGGDAACDKTWAEISQAYNGGRTINAFYYDSQFGLFGLQVSFAKENANLTYMSCESYSFDLSNGSLVSGRNCFISTDGVECVAT